MREDEAARRIPLREPWAIVGPRGALLAATAEGVLAGRRTALRVPHGAEGDGAALHWGHLAPEGLGGGRDGGGRRLRRRPLAPEKVGGLGVEGLAARGARAAQLGATCARAAQRSGARAPGPGQCRCPGAVTRLANVARLALSRTCADNMRRRWADLCVCAPRASCAPRERRKKCREKTHYVGPVFKHDVLVLPERIPPVLHNCVPDFNIPKSLTCETLTEMASIQGADQ